MSPIDSKGEPACDTCGRHADMSLASAMYLGWGYWAGQTGGGSDREHVICRDCRTTSHKRPVRKEQGFEDEPLF